MYRKRLRMLTAQGIRREHRILDFGCGTGVFVQFLRENGFSQTSGYDVFVPAYADREVLNERYDAVVSFDVIEHLADPKQFLSDMSDLVNADGSVIIGTPNADFLSVPGGSSPDIELSQPYHRHILSERSLLNLCHKRGLGLRQLYRGAPMDSWIPGINARFMWAYIKHMGGVVDVAMEPPRVPVILLSPTLLFYALFGSFFPPKGNIVVVLKKEM